MRFKQPGPWLFAVGMIGLGLAALMLAFVPSSPLAPGRWMAPPVCLILAGAGLLLRRTSAAAAAILALYWLAWLVFVHVPALIGQPDGLTLWVSAATALTFAALAAAFVQPGFRVVARAALGVTVALFGVVHLLIPDAVAGLLPDWFPLAGLWPFLTGMIQIGLGLMILTGFGAAVAAFVLGLIWLSWLPLVHVPRLIAAPDALFEWTFMLTAVALAGAAWSAGERIAVPPGEDFQSSAR